jgi:hypothetical protein
MAKFIAEQNFSSCGAEENRYGEESFFNSWDSFSLFSDLCSVQSGS